MRYRFLFLLLPAFLAWMPAAAQQLRSPLDIPLVLSANFGELRPNHFHSGLDMKTQLAVGKTVRAVADGYVSRISVSPYGYGNALYLNHPDGTTTVYGHLLRFNDSIAAYVRQKQYEAESFRVDFTLPPGRFPVKAGQEIALSGNSGSSGGPHLHFEIRDTRTEEPLDPLVCYKDRITDTRPPRIRSVRIYPLNDKGVVNGGTQPVTLQVHTGKDGRAVLSGEISAWGEIGFAVRAYDAMDGTENIYGVKDVRLTSGDTLLFHSRIDRYAFHETRYINSLIDYGFYRTHQALYMKNFLEPGNRLRFLEAPGDGVLSVDVERPYRLCYRLSDEAGNTTVLEFAVLGREQPIAPPDTAGTSFFSFRTDNRFGAKGIRLFIPRGNLYDDLHFRYSAEPDPDGPADRHRLHDRSPVAFHRGAELSIRVRQDTPADPARYGIVRLDKGRRNWIGGTYREGWIDAVIRETGCYTVAADTVPPKIVPVNAAEWPKRRKFVFRLSDDLSGTDRYRATIDGQFALFELDGKTGTLTYVFDRKRLRPGRHVLLLTATDAAGNEAVYRHDFTL